MFDNPSNGIPIRYRVGTLAEGCATRQLHYIDEVLYAHSPEVLRVLIMFPAPARAPLWHDDSTNCATWTDAAECKCMVSP